MRASDDSHFDASGPVGRYWLTNGVGFTVCGSHGEEVGVVVHVALDRRGQRAERMIVRRPGLVRRSRYVAIDPRAIESVLPDTQQFLVPAVERAATPASRSPAVARVGATGASARAAVRAFVRASRPLVSELDRRLAAALAVAVRLSRRGARATADVAVRTSQRARRDAPRLEAWVSAHARETGRVALTVLRLLGALACSAARLLGDVAVLAAVAAVATWRRAAARVQQASASAPREPERSEPPDPEPREWRRDADSPLVRERSARASRRSDRRSRR